MFVCLSVSSMCVCVCVSKTFWCVIPEAPLTPSQVFPLSQTSFFFYLLFFLTTGFWTQYVSISKTTAFHKHDGIFVLECLKGIFSSF